MEAVQEAYSKERADDDDLSDSGDESSSDEEEMQVEKQVSDLEATVSIQFSSIIANVHC